ncbi:MAG: hypothetical protein FWD81_04820 [Methanomassiliicoccaceae archaeon]|nr:hypothetical protein [Methanomassiliicoccaceae archaeon]
MSRLTISDRVVLHLSRYELLSEDEFNAAWDLTQDGIAASLRISRAHSSLELKKLKEKGKITEYQSHFKGGKVKRRAYRLTQTGMEYARHLKESAEEEGIDIMPMLDMKRCDPKKLWESVGEENLDALGLACILRCSVPRTDLPETSKPVIPADVNGMTLLSDIVKRNVVSVADEERRREWHSAAADYWLDRDNVRERLYHLVGAGRSKDACRLVAAEKDMLTTDIDGDLVNILAKLDDIPEKYATEVLPVKISASVWSGDLKAAGPMIASLTEMDRDIGVLYSADLETRKGNRSGALDIIRSIDAADRFEVVLGKAGVLGRLGMAKEALDLLMDVKESLVRAGSVDGLDRVYIQMADVSAANGDDDSSVNYLTKALGVTNDIGRRRIYRMLAVSYGAIGMTSKAKECALKAK